MSAACRAAVDALVADAPPLTPEQRDRLRALLRGVPRAEGPPEERSAPREGGAVDERAGRAGLGGRRA